MAFPTTLKNLASILQLRKQSGAPYNLLLTSTISLTPEVLESITGSADWNVFCNLFRRLGNNDRIALMRHYLNQSNDPEGYGALTRLIKEGYFSTILTANLDSFLEDALPESGLRPDAYQTLVVDRDNDEHIATALESYRGGIRIVKLRGRLRDEVIPKAFPEFFEFRSSIRSALERYINQDIVIVGTIEREDDIRRSLAQRGGSIYYVIPQEPTEDDEVVKAIEARGNDPNAFVISGHYGQFGMFFRALESILLSDSRDNRSVVIQTPVSPQVEHPELNTPTVPPTLVEPAVSPTLSGTESEKENSLLTYAIRFTSVFVVVVSILGLLLGISRFLNQTPSFSPLWIFPLLLMLAAIVLGAIGILNPAQIVSLLSLAMNVVHGLPKDKIDKDLANDNNSVLSE